MNGNNARTFTPLYDDFHTELKGGAAWAYAAIYRFCMMRNGECTASNETLAKAAHMSVRTFIRNKHWLEKHGYITDIAGSYATSTHVLKITENPIDTQNNPAQCHSDTMSQCHSEQGGVLNMDRHLLNMSNKDTIKKLIEMLDDQLYSIQSGRIN